MASEPTSMTASTTRYDDEGHAPLALRAGHWDTLQTTFLSGTIEAYT